MKKAFGWWLCGLEIAAPLVLRFTVGWVFFVSGWGKLHNLAGVTEFFVSLGIPFAAFQAPMVAVFEFVFGLALLVGLYTRLAALPLMAVMLVATITAKPEAFASLDELLETSEVLYLVILLALATYGGGKVSVDQLLKRKP